SLPSATVVPYTSLFRSPGAGPVPAVTALRGRLQVLATTEVGPHRLGHPDRTVRLLVVLQNRHEPPGGCQRTVESGGGLWLTVLVAVADTQSTRLERGAVRRRGHLPVGLLRRHPRLAVELPCCRRPQVPTCDVDDAVRHLDLGQHPFFRRQQPAAFGLGLLRVAVN